MEILLTRHGQTEWNLLKKVQGKADIELNEKGIEQAETIRVSLKEERIDLILCSPLKRAIQTAEIINQGKNIRMIIDERLSERDFGEFEGMSNTDFDFNAFWSYKQNLKYDKAENIKDFFYRVYTKLDNIENKYKDKNILFVTHGGVSIAIDCYVNGMPDQESLLNLAIRKW